MKRKRQGLIAVLASMTPALALGQPGEAIYTIPVVFHVLHVNGPENISDAQIAEALATLNAHYDAPVWPLLPPFDAIAGDMDIRFELAPVDPDGAPSTGIERIFTVETLSAGAPSSFVNPWPRECFLNIWVVKGIESGAAIQCLAPVDADSQPGMDGLMILHDWLGATGTSTPAHSHAFTYGVGRFLNLKRLCEELIDGGPCGDDEVEDTPPCDPLALPWCDNAQESCLAGVPTNDENFMQSSYCARMFTQGQRLRVHECLMSDVAQRSSLAASFSIGMSCGISAVGSGSAVSGMTVLEDHGRLRFTGLRSEVYRVRVLATDGRVLLAASSAGSRLMESGLQLPAALPAGPLLVLAESSDAVFTARIIRH